MATTKLLLCLSLISILTATSLSATKKSNLFMLYIGSQFTGIKFTDVPINPNAEFHFILSFALDYTTSSSPSPTNGRFNIFWDNENLSPSAVTAVKQDNRNVKVALSLGGNAVGEEEAFFDPSSIDSWVSNAVTTLTSIIKQNNLDGIDIDYEHFKADPNTFAECIGQLITTLKDNGVISFASIAPFDDGQVQSHYEALWKKYGDVIDYVNFQFYAYDAGISVKQYLSFFEEQSKNYDGKKLLVSYSTDSDSGGLSPADGGFFSACNILKKQGKLIGIFVWSADTSKSDAFKHETQSQSLLSSGR